MLPLLSRPVRAHFCQGRFERFPAGQRMQQVELAFLVEIAGQDEPASLAEFSHPRGVSGTKLFFELLTNFLSQRRTLSSGRNGNLQIAAIYDRGIVEIAKIGNVDHVAEHAPSLCFAIDAFIQGARIRGDDCEESTVQVVIREGAQLEFEFPGARPLANRRTCIERNHADAGARFEQATRSLVRQPFRIRRPGTACLPVSETWGTS
jgi:hypothetical protein